MSDREEAKQLREELAAARQELAERQQDFERELQIAAQVHKSMLPAPVRNPRIDVDVKYLPFGPVGGDYCQVRFLDSAYCYVTMCDVSGHDIGSSLLATRVSSEVRRYILDRLRPVEIVQSLNSFIYNNFQDAAKFLTFVAARIDLERSTITYSGAGHPPVLHMDGSSRSVQPLESQNLPIGVQQECLLDNPEQTRPISPGDRLLFYTDGLIEASDENGIQLGVNGLANVASETGLESLFDMADTILRKVTDFRCGPPDDDLTLIVAEIK